MTYGDTRPHQTDYEAKRAAFLDSIQDCRYCKSAKTRAMNKLSFVIDNGYDPDGVIVTKQRARAAQALCKAHGERLRLIYVTHPASETYWSS